MSLRMVQSLHGPPHTREEIHDAARYLAKQRGKGAANEAKRLATERTVRGRDFWFAVTEILGGDTTGWRDGK